MEQTVENGEIGEQAVGEDAVEIEFQIAELDEARAVAQEAQHTAVRDEAVKLLVEVEELLDDAWADMRRVGVLGLSVKASGSR